MNDQAQALWNKIINGDIDLEDPEVLNMGKRSAQFQAQVAELREVQAELGEAGGEMDAILAEARRDEIRVSDHRLMESIPGRHATEAENQTTEAPRLHAPRLLTTWIGLAAALLIAVGGWAWFQSGQETNPYGPILGGPDSITLVMPVGQTQAFDLFQWEGDLELGGWAIVRVVDLDTGEERLSTKVSTHRWSPQSAIEAQRVRWSVSYYAPSGDLVGTSQTVEAWR